MLRLRSTLIIFAALNSVVKAQTSPFEEQGDTIAPVPAVITFYKTLDSLRGDTICTLPHDKGYVIQTTGGWSAKAYIALKVKKGYDTFDACPDIDADSFFCEPFSFDGKGSEELIIHWKETGGHGGIFSHLRQEYAGIVLWNLDRQELIFSLITQLDDEVTSIEYATDSLGEMTGDIARVTTEHYCDDWDATIGFKTVSIRRAPDCPYADENGNNTIPPDPRYFIYKWTSSGLVLEH